MKKPSATTTTTTLRLPAELYEKLRESAFKSRKSINATITALIRLGIRRAENEK